MSVTVVELQNVVKEYRLDPPVSVLHGINLSIHSGERVAIVGASGSGKTTMLSIMGTLDRPTTGRVLIGGVDTATLDEAARAEVRSASIGFVFQQFFLLPTMSALENVELGLLYSGFGGEARQVRALAALNQVGLSDRAGHRPGQLSGGEQQRVAIARALVRQPTVLFADEPTGALDSATGESIFQLLLTAADQGTAVVIVTHDQSLAARMDRCIVLRDGRIVADTGSAASSPEGVFQTKTEPDASRKRGTR